MRAPVVMIRGMGSDQDGHRHNARTPAMVKARPGWSQISAVRDGKIYPVDADLLTRPGPRLADGLEALAKIIHPELFK